MYLVRDGEASELTTILKFDLLPGSLASGAIGQREKLAYEYTSVPFQSKDRLILATDGLVNNVSPEVLAALIQSSASPDEAVSALAELVGEKRRLQQGQGRPVRHIPGRRPDGHNPLLCLNFE